MQLKIIHPRLGSLLYGNTHMLKCVVSCSNEHRVKEVYLFRMSWE